MFPFCWIKASHIGKSHILGKQVSLLAFRQVLTKILPVECIQLHNYDLFEKARLKLSPLKSSSFRQDYHMPGIFLLNKNAKKLVAPTRCGLYLFPLNLYGKPWIWGKILPNTQKCTHFDHQKNDPSLIDLSLTLLKVLFLPHQIAIFN